MYKYFIFSSFFFFFISLAFISEKAISDETSQTSHLERGELECISALNALPQTFKKVGVSNIEITEGDITIIKNELAELLKNGFKGMFRGANNIEVEITQLLLFSNILYNISFSVNGQIKNIPLIFHKSIDDANTNDSINWISRLSVALGNLPEKVLSLADYIFFAPTPRQDPSNKKG